MAKVTTLRRLEFKQNLTKTRPRDLLTALEVRLMPHLMHHICANKTLHKELSSIAQENVDLESLKDVASQLVSKTLISHKESGVRAYTASCLTDILRLFAPDAPYTLRELGSIFQFLVKEFANLGKSDHPYYKQYYHMLEVLVQVQCIVLITDLPKAETLTRTIFQCFYDFTSRENVGGLDFLMTSILSQLVDQAQSLPSDVTELVLNQFLTRIPKSKDAKNQSIPLVSRSYNMSKVLCADNVPIMTRLVDKYFSDNLSRILSTDRPPPLDEDDEEEDEDDGQADIVRLGVLMEEIWKAVPELLANVIGQIEQNLEIEDDEIRLVTTRTLGNIIGYPTSRINFVREHSSTFKAWIGRSKDKDPNIRIAWIKATEQIIENRVNGVKEVVEQLVVRHDDPNEKTRQQYCRTVGSLSVATIVAKLDLAFLKTLADRLRDRKQSVRQEAFEAVGSLFDQAFPRLEAGESRYVEMFDWVPTELVDLVFINNKELNEQVDKAFCEHIFPNEQDDDARTRRLLTIVKSLTPHSYKGFLSLCRRQVVLAEHLSNLLNYSREVHASGRPELKSKIELILRAFNAQYSQGDRVVEHLVQMLEINNKHDLKLLAICFSPESEYSTVQSAMSDILKRAKPQFNTSLRLILYRCSYLNLNRSNITSIVKISRDSRDSLHEISNSFLKEIAAIQPFLMQSQVMELATIIETSSSGDGGFANTLKAASILFKKFPDHVSWSPALTKSLTKLCLQGSCREAKQAVRILESSDKKEMHFKGIVDKILENLNKRDGSLTSTHLSTLAEVCLHVPDLIHEQADRITSHILKEILLANHVQAKDDEPEWVEDHDLEEECWRKIYSIRFLTNRISALSHYVNVEQLAIPVFKVLISLIGNGGELVSAKKGATPDRFKTRLRLEGGRRLLKLAQIPTFEKTIRATDLSRLVLLLQDSCFESRRQFTQKLTRYLTKNLLPSRYLALLFFLAFEPDLELRGTTTTWLRARFARQQAGPSKSTVMEEAISRLLSLLAHHPGIFDPEEPSLKTGLTNAFGYILYYLSIVATTHNLSLIFYLAQSVKKYQDASTEEDGDEDEVSDKIYMMSDLAQLCIMKLQELKGWNMVTWPGKISLPSDAFQLISDSEIAKKVAKTLYIPEELQEELEEDIRKTWHKLISTSATLKGHKHEVVKKAAKPSEKESNAGGLGVKKGSGENGNATTKKTKVTSRKRRSDERDENREPVERRRSGRTRTAVNYAMSGGGPSSEPELEESEMSDA